MSHVVVTFRKISKFCQSKAPASMIRNWQVRDWVFHCYSLHYSSVNKYLEISTTSSNFYFILATCDISNPNIHMPHASAIESPPTNYLGKLPSISSRDGRPAQWAPGSVTDPGVNCHAVQPTPISPLIWVLTHSDHWGGYDGGKLPGVADSRVRYVTWLHFRAPSSDSSVQLQLGHLTGGLSFVAWNCFCNSTSVTIVTHTSWSRAEQLKCINCVNFVTH